MPLVSILLLVIWVFCHNPVRIIGLTLLCFSLSVLFSYLSDPGYDHSFYNFFVGRYPDFLTAAADHSPNAGGISGFYWLFARVLDGSTLAVLAANSLLLALSFSEILAIFNNSGRAAVLSSLCIVIMLIPTIALLSISYNKDICIVLALSVIFNQTAKLFAKERPQKLFTLAMQLLVLLIALYCLYIMRYYFLMFYLSAFGFLLVDVVLSRKVYLFRLWLRARYPLAILASSLIVIVLWEVIRQKVEVYLGNSTIFSIYEKGKPRLWSILELSIQGSYQNLAGVAEVLICSSTLSEKSRWAGLLEQFIFVSSFAHYVIKSPDSVVKRLFVLFAIFHLSIQLWASPNIGGLLRLRVFETIWLGIFALSFLSKRRAGVGLVRGET